MKNIFSYSFILIIIVTIVISILGFGSTINDYSFYNINADDIFVSSKGFTWPLPNKYYISSYFGYRNLSLYGASNYHSGIDIPAPQDTYFLATMSGQITYLGFSGSGRLYHYFRT